MAATITWVGQSTTGSDNVTMASSDLIRFSGATFATRIRKTYYNDGTHVENSGGTERCTPVHLNNDKKTAAGKVSINGAAEIDLITAINGQACLKVNFSNDISVEAIDIKFYAYDGTTPATAPANMTVYGALIGDSTWTDIGGSANALLPPDQSTGTSHDFYFLISVVPTTTGTLTALKFKIELSYV
jgi:hypothetical protein